MVGFLHIIVDLALLDGVDVQRSQSFLSCEKPFTINFTLRALINCSKIDVKLSINLALEIGDDLVVLFVRLVRSLAELLLGGNGSFAKDLKEFDWR